MCMPSLDFYSKYTSPVKNWDLTNYLKIFELENISWGTEKNFVLNLDIQFSF